MTARADPADRRADRRCGGGGRGIRSRGDSGAPGPDRRGRRRRARFPARRRHRRARRRGGCRPQACRRGAARPAGRRAAGAQGRHDHRRHADDMRLEDPRGLAAALRRDGDQAAARRRRGHPRQDEHGRVRDGVLDRELRLRAEPQPVGSRAASPAARPAARPRPSPPTRRRWRSAPTPAARSASLRRSAASSG